MLLNLTPKTHGYTTQATLTGSYGEKVFARVGRAYPTLMQAWLARERLRTKYPDVLIIDPKGVACMPEAKYWQERLN